MERHAHGASLFNTFSNLFRRGQSSSADEQVDSDPQLAPVLHSHFQSSGPIQLSRQMTPFPASPNSPAADDDVEMFIADPPTDSLYSTADLTDSTPDSSQLTSLPHTGTLATSSLPADSEAPEITHPSVIDDDAHSDTSMPPLYDASDSEAEEDHLRHGGYDSMSESEVDAYDVEMTLLIDHGDLSDEEDSALPNDRSPQLPSTPLDTADSYRIYRHVIVEEVEDQDQQRTDTIPSASSAQPGPSSQTETHSHSHPQAQFQPHLHHHHHPHPHPHQYPHPPPPQPSGGGVPLPNFPAMPGLRAQGQVEGQVPLPGLRTLFQPLIVEAVAQAGERFRMAQGTSGPAGGQGPTMGPAAPIVQVTFDVPVFRIPPDARRQQPQAEVPSDVNGQGQADEHERASASSPPRPEHPNPNPTTFNFTPLPQNPNPAGTDAMQPVLRQFFEAAFNPEPAELPIPDGPQTAAAPGLTGLMGLLLSLGFGAPHELNREDPVRAKRLVKGLEVVNAGLVKRMRKIGEGNADGAICAICWDALLEEDGEITPHSVAEAPLWDATSNRGQPTNAEPDATNPAEPESEPEEPLPRIIALPCSHVFHSACLVPWFSRPKQTTCPSCRFNVDPDNLTYEPPRRPQSDSRQQPQQQRPPQPAAPQQQEQEQQGSTSSVALPPQQAAQQQDEHPHPPSQMRTIFEHTFTIPFPPPGLPLAHPQLGNAFPQPQSEVRPQGPGQQGPFQMPTAAMDPSPPFAFLRAFQSLRHLNPHTQHRPQPPPNGTPVQEGSAPPPAPLHPQAQPLPGQGLQPPPQDGQRNANGMPRFPGLFQFDLPQLVRMSDGTWFWSAPVGGFPSATTTTTTHQGPPRPVAPKRKWEPPPAPGLTLRQRVEQGERERGLRCDDMSCGLGPSDDDPEPTTDLARVVIQPLGDGVSGCGHMFHPTCLVSAERVAGWGPDNEGERERAGGLVKVSCSVCRAVGVVPRDDWEKGVQALT